MDEFGWITKFNLNLLLFYAPAMGSTTTSGHFGPVLHSAYANQQMDFVVPDDGNFRIAGGSSGGCAVAVATGIADVFVCF
jgi:Asp-tRNA(Asn)/Glu-tRNA(Gln) amidotransferase A subunit family amidase